MDEKLPTILIGDVLRIKQIMNNILSNAFKYTESGVIELSMKCEKNEINEDNVTLIISVRDTGLGMTEEQLSSLNNYNEYIRFHEHKNLHIMGTGLGMPITYNLVRMMNAEIEINSAVGEGTHMVIRIPQQIATHEVLGKKLVQDLQQFKVDSQSSKRRFEFESEPMPYGSVLVVDDVKVNLYVAQSLMEFYDLKIDTCDSSYEAIEKIKLGNVYDIIFMDHINIIESIKSTKNNRLKNTRHRQLSNG